MKVAYIAGPFGAVSQWDRRQNIVNAQTLGLLVATFGISPIIPHSNTGDFFGELTEPFWYEATLELTRRSDAVIMLPRWKASKGAMKEFKEAVELGIPTHQVTSFNVPASGLSAVAEFCQWLNKTPDGFRFQCTDRDKEDLLRKAGF